MSKRDKIIAAVTSLPCVEFVDIIDESEKHRGHVSNNMSSESHFKLILKIKDEYMHMTSLQVHRQVFAALGELMAQIHALSIDIKR